MSSTDTYKPGHVLPLEVVYRSVFEELTEVVELGKCLHAKTQNANESFNGKVWDSIPKTKFISLRFGVYDAVDNILYTFRTTNRVNSRNKMYLQILRAKKRRKVTKTLEKEAKTYYAKVFNFN